MQEFEDKSKGPEKNSPFSLVLVFCCGVGVCMGALFLGFMYGDRYGREHAQYDNPALRTYYAGQCFDYMEKEFLKTARSVMGQGGQVTSGHNPGLQVQLEEIRQGLDDVKLAVKLLRAQLGQKYTQGKNPRRNLRHKIAPTEENAH